MHTTRRTFLKGLAASAIAPTIIPWRVLADGPSKRMTTGLIGMGTQMHGLRASFSGLSQVLAVCDVDTTRRNDGLQAVNAFYTQQKDKGVADCKAYADYREVIGRKDIDMVCIATPDHWHAPITMLALANGKDVYCEKPLTHCLQEAIDVMKAVDANKRVLQTGAMQRSMKEFRIACELVRNGCIGKVDHIDCSFGAPPKPCDLKEEPLEAGLDWNMWLGNAPMRPYNSVLSPRGVHHHFPNWRMYCEYGTGMIGDWGAHHLDIAQWALGMDDSGPVEVRPPAKKGDSSGASMIYANGVVVTHKPGNGVHIYGSDGEIIVNRGKFKAVVKGQTFDGGEKGTSCAAAVQKAEKALLQDAKVKLYDSKTHPSDFVACAVSRQKPNSNEQVGGRTAICCHLMLQAYYNQAVIKWDPAKLCFAGGTGDPKWMTTENRDWTKTK